MFQIITMQIIKMLLLLLLGIFCYRKKLIDQPGSKMLANLLLMIVNPALAISSLQVDYDPALVSGLLLSYALAILTHFVMIALSTLIIKSKGNEEFAIERFAAIYANCGFMGIPLVQSVLGNEGVLYVTAYMTVFNIFTWTHGLGIMTGNFSFKEVKKGLLSPMVIACLVGLVLFFLKIRLPDVIGDTLTYISQMNTPLAMLIAGVSVAQTNIPAMLKNKKIYFISAFKLLFMPAVVLLILIPLHLPFTVACTILIASACPSAATGTAFALRCHKNYKYYSELYAFTTLLSLVTIPLCVYAAERFLVS